MPTVAQPIIIQKGPYKTAVEAGKKYAWCACGMSKEQPFCDGSHKGSGMNPVVIKAEKSEDVWFCGCKHTKTGVFCDGTHNGL